MPQSNTHIHKHRTHTDAGSLSLTHTHTQVYYFSLSLMHINTPTQRLDYIHMHNTHTPNQNSNTHTPKQTHIQAHTQKSHIQTHIHTWTQTHICTHEHKPTFTHKQTHIHTHTPETNPHSNTYTHSLFLCLHSVWPVCTSVITAPSGLTCAYICHYCPIRSDLCLHLSLLPHPNWPVSTSAQSSLPHPPPPESSQPPDALPTLSGLVWFCAVDDDADDAVDLAGLSRDGVERDEVDLGGVGRLCRVCCCEQSNHNIQLDVSDSTSCHS